MTETLVHWAWKKGHLWEVAPIFSIDKWRDIRDRMWDSVSNGGKEEKLLQTLGPLWRSIINSLEAMQAERQVAAAAIQALAATTNLASEFDASVRLITHPACSSAGQVKASVEEAAPDLSNDTAAESSAVLQQVKGAIPDITPDGHCQAQPPAESQSDDGASSPGPDSIRSSHPIPDRGEEKSRPPPSLLLPSALPLKATLVICIQNAQISEKHSSWKKRTGLEYLGIQNDWWVVAQYILTLDAGATKLPHHSRRAAVPSRRCPDSSAVQRLSQLETAALPLTNERLGAGQHKAVGDNTATDGCQDSCYPNQRSKYGHIHPFSFAKPGLQPPSERIVYS
nr:IG-like receptor CHIR-B3-like protein [Meleagris gallopavo]